MTIGRIKTIALLSAALVLVTACYAVLTFRILRSNRTILAETKRITEETRRLADVGQTTYLASLAPAIDSSSAIDAANPNDTITVGTTLTNLCTHPVTIMKMYVESDTPEVGRRVYEETFNVALRNHERIRLQMEVPGPRFDLVWFLVQDIAGQHHEIGATGVKTYTPVARV